MHLILLNKNTSSLKKKKKRKLFLAERFEATLKILNQAKINYQKGSTYALYCCTRTD